MKAIKFSDSELAFIKEHYESELESAEKYIVHVKEILAKLGVPKRLPIDVLPNKEEKIAKKRGRRPGKKTAGSTDAPKKRGRPPKSGSTEKQPELEKVVPEIKQEKKKPTLKLKRKQRVQVEKPAIDKIEVSAVTPEGKDSAQKKIKKPTKRRAYKRRKGKVFLAALSKPLKKKEPVPEQPLDIMSPPEVPPPQEPKE
jgi:hypothetical protein